MLGGFRGFRMPDAGRFRVPDAGCWKVSGEKLGAPPCLGLKSGFVLRG